MDFQSHGYSRRSNREKVQPIPRRNRARRHGDIIVAIFKINSRYARIYNYVTNLNPKIHYQPSQSDITSTGVFHVRRYPSDRDRTLTRAKAKSHGVNTYLRSSQTRPGSRTGQVRECFTIPNAPDTPAPVPIATRHISR